MVVGPLKGSPDVVCHFQLLIALEHGFVFLVSIIMSEQI